MENIIGSIEIGKKADIIMINMNDINTAPNIDIITNLCHNALNNVEMTMVNGNILMKDKKINIDESKLIDKINEIVERLNGE